MTLTKLAFNFSRFQAIKCAWVKLDAVCRLIVEKAEQLTNKVLTIDFHTFNISTHYKKKKKSKNMNIKDFHS